MLLFGRLGLEGLLFLARLLLLSALVLNAFVVWCLLFYVLLGPGFQGFCCLGAWVLNRVVVWRCVVVFCVAGALGFKFVCFLVVCFECLCCLRAGALKIYVFGTFVVVFALLGLWVSRAFVVWVLVF